MVDGGIIGEEPAIRISAGSANRPLGQDLVHSARELSTSITTAEVGPTGIQDLEPLLMATRDGETAFFPECSIERAQAVTEDLDSGSLSTDEAMAVVEHEPETADLPAPEGSALDVGERTVLSACGWTVPTSIEDSRTCGLFAPSDVPAIPQLHTANLRGRGRGDGSVDTPIADHWSTAKEIEDEAAVVVNANETDPHAEMDRILLESDPYAVLDGALAASRAIEATNMIVYLSKADELARERVGNAAATLSEEFDDVISIEVLAGPDEYKAGEMTMAIEALEGNHRLEARLRPPHPSEQGLYGRPTIVHTPRTLVQVSSLLRGGAGVSASSDPGTRLFTVTGNADPATVELSTDDDIATARNAIDFDGHVKAACVGGVFGGLARSLDIPARINALTAAGLGTNGVIELLGEDECMVSFAGRRASFAEEENCGRCVPCREGTQQLTDILRNVYDGEYQSAKLRELLRVMRETSICQFGQAAPRPVLTAMDEFEPEFRAHANGHCPTGACE